MKPHRNELKDLLKHVLLEVQSSFTTEEMKAFKSFEDFWEQVDIQNAYEDEWKSWKRKGIKKIYKAVFEQKDIWAKE